MKIIKEKANPKKYKESREIIKIVDSAYKKALVFTKTDFQKKLERLYRLS